MNFKECLKTGSENYWQFSQDIKNCGTWPNLFLIYSSGTAKKFEKEK